VRVVPDGRHEATCRLRVWCDEGPTVIVESHARSGDEAVRNAVDSLSRTLGRRFDSPRPPHHRRRGPAARISRNERS
jgi:hypothetical protein